jgi:hypothetical protein
VVGLKACARKTLMHAKSGLRDDHALVTSALYAHMLPLHVKLISPDMNDDDACDLGSCVQSECVQHMRSTQQSALAMSLARW